MAETNLNGAASTNGASASGGGDAGGGEKLRLGGMALRNGLLVHGPTHWAAAARAKDGSIEAAAGPKPNFGGNAVAKVPILRGPIRLAEAFAVIPIARRRVRSSRLPFEDPKVIGAGLVATVVSNVVRGSDPSPARETAAGVVGLAPAMVALSGSELASYHSVEHKHIGGYEQDADPATVPKEHQRCGSNLIGPMMLFSALTQIGVERLVERPGRIARGIGGVLGLSLAVEAFALAEKHPESPIGRAVHWSGDAIQRAFATREPNPTQMEVGKAALDALLDAEASSSR